MAESSFTDKQLSVAIGQIVNKSNLNTITPRAIRHQLAERLCVDPAELEKEKSRLQEITKQVFESVLKNSEEDEEDKPIAPIKTEIKTETKKRKQESEEDEQPAKVVKKESKVKQSKSEESSLTKNSQGEIVIPLGGDLLRCTVRTFRGMHLIDIRKFYVDKASGDVKPGNKGISLTPQQWNELKQHMDTIDKAVSMM